MAYVQFYICVFSILFWLTIIDKNVVDYLHLIYKFIWINYEKLKWMIVYHPKNPITNWIMARKYSKLAEDLLKELQQKQL